MEIHVITLFPDMFRPVLGESILKRACERGYVTIALYNLRDYTTDARRTVDDKPYGGGPGMVLMVKPIDAAVKEIKASAEQRSGKKATRVVLLSPQGRPYSQKKAREFVNAGRLILICGHYEGFDERIRQLVADEDVSVGDYVLTCGEIPAMVLIDSVVRLVPGVLGDVCSPLDESFENGLLEYPQYTRPAVYNGHGVPEVLLSGDHQKIRRWRRRQSVQATKRKRPDLLRHAHIPEQ